MAYGKGLIDSDMVMFERSKVRVVIKIQEQPCDDFDSREMPCGINGNGWVPQLASEQQRHYVDYAYTSIENHVSYGPHAYAYDNAACFYDWNHMVFYPSA